MKTKLQSAKKDYITKKEDLNQIKKLIQFLGKIELSEKRGKDLIKSIKTELEKEYRKNKRAFISKLKVVALISLVLFNPRTSFAINENKIHKSENEKATVQTEGTYGASNEINRCVNNRNLDSCWDFYYSKTEKDKSSYRSSVRQIRNSLIPLCKTGSEDYCSLLATINYEEFADISSIAMMEKYLESNPSSNRWVDLLLHYLGKGKLASEVDQKKIEGLAKNCFSSSKVDFCASYSILVLFSDRLTDADARRLAIEMFEKGMRSFAADPKTKSFMEKILNCQIEVAKVGDADVIASAIRIPFSVKNLGNYSVEIYMDIHAFDAADHQRRFSGLLSVTHPIKPNGLYEDKVLFQISKNSDIEAKNFYKNRFRLDRSTITNIVFGPGESSTYFPQRLCKINTKF